MEFVGADADLRAEPELVPVVESRAGIDDNGRRVDLRNECPGRCQIVRDDRVRVMRAIGGNVLDRIAKRVNHLDGKNQVEILGPEVIVRRRRE